MEGEPLEVPAEITWEGGVCTARRQQRGHPCQPGVEYGRQHRSYHDGRPDEGNPSQLEQSIVHGIVRTDAEERRAHLYRQGHHK